MESIYNTLLPDSVAQNIIHILTPASNDEQAAAYPSTQFVLQADSGHRSMAKISEIVTLVKLNCCRITLIISVA